MKTLVIPDPHERLDAVEQVLQVKHDQVVFLGDWFDTFKPWDEDRIMRVCAFITRNIDNPDYVFLMGNHDIHYASPSAHYCCSGFNLESKSIIRSMLKSDTWLKFKVFLTVGGYTLSHAGFREETLQYMKPEVCDEAMRRAVTEGVYDSLFGAGQARGGRQAFGGPLWLDWHYEFYAINEVPQIVGHTADRIPRVKTAGGPLPSYCIDTHSQHYIMLEDDTVAVRGLKDHKLVTF